MKIILRRLKEIILWIIGSTKSSRSPLLPSPRNNTPERPDIRHPFLQNLAQHYDGKLLLATEISLEDSLFEKLISHHYFTPVKGIKLHKYSLECRRCHNKSPHLFAKFPCYRCQEEAFYCRNCLHMGRITTCENLYYWTGAHYVWPKVKDACTWQGKLTTSQSTAAQQIKRTILQGGEKLVWAVTGSGKTEMLFPGITAALAKGKRVCLATPRADVVRELLPRLQEAFRGIRVQGLYGGSRDHHGTTQLMLATTHQLYRFQNIFDVIIIDELDAFPYHNDLGLQQATKRAAKESCAIIYLTATPRKKEKEKINRGQLPHVFVPIRFHEKPLIIPRMKICTNLQSNLQKGNLPPQFLHWIQSRQKKSRQILIFVPTIYLANELNQAITEAFMNKQMIGEKSQIVTVHAADKDRAEKIEEFRKREIYGLITTTILERGVTFPEIDVAVLDAGHVVFDEPALVQIAGRAGRSPVDPGGEVIFFHDGKTNAMVEARRSIMEMNQRANDILGKRKEKD